jgi:hypothetical protein
MHTTSDKLTKPEDMEAATPTPSQGSFEEPAMVCNHANPDTPLLELRAFAATKIA